MPAWMLERLRAENPDGVNRGARLDRCEDCGRKVLRGLDDDKCAMAATVDPIELDHFGEYLALARGLRTYTIARRYSSSGKPRWEIDPRMLVHVRDAERTHAVVPQHRCGIWLPTPERGGIFARLRPPPSDDLDNPPF